MSLETAGFIKDLVATNPEGTDPKSQGDDHIRMLKAVLKAQFPGFTEGLGINLKETNLNLLGGQGVAQAVVNIDTPVLYTCFLAISSGSTGTKPPGASGGGQIIINTCYSTNFIYQQTAVSRAIFNRFWNGTVWSPWECQTPIGTAQVWTDVTAGRVLGTTYTNNTNQAISVSVVLVGAGASRSFANLTIAGLTVDVTTTNEINSAGAFVAMTMTVNGIVPPGATYVCSVSGGGGSISAWRELR